MIPLILYPIIIMIFIMHTTIFIDLFIVALITNLSGNAKIKTGKNKYSSKIG